MKTHTKFPSSSGKSSSASRIGDRGFQVLALACEERAIRLDLAARVLGVRPSALVPIVDRLEVAELAAQERFLVKERYPWVWPTRPGVKQDGRGYRFCEPAVSQLQHMAWVAGVRAMCVGTDPDAVWVPERLLCKESGRSEGHLADGALLFKDGLVPVEAERTRKDLYKVVAGMASLVERFGGARYYCSLASRPGVERAVAMGGFEEKVVVLDGPAFA
jgi:hypothetical protein